MTREEYLKEKISKTNVNAKTLAKIIDVPYSTLRDMLNNVGSARVDNVIKLCQYLNITVEQLQAAQENTVLSQDVKSDTLKISALERRLLEAFNKLTDEDKLIEVGRIEHIAEQTEEKDA